MRRCAADLLQESVVNRIPNIPPVRPKRQPISDFAGGTLAPHDAPSADSDADRSNGTATTCASRPDRDGWRARALAFGEELLAPVGSRTRRRMDARHQALSRAPSSGPPRDRPHRLCGSHRVQQEPDGGGRVVRVTAHVGSTHRGVLPAGRIACPYEVRRRWRRRRGTRGFARYRPGGTPRGRPRT